MDESSSLINTELFGKGVLAEFLPTLKGAALWLTDL